MTSALEAILEKWCLNQMFDGKKGSLVEAVWSYIDGFELVNVTEPPPQTLKAFIRLTIQYLPEVVKFQIQGNSPKELKDDVLNYLIDKMYQYTLEKLTELKRGSIQQET